MKKLLNRLASSGSTLKNEQFSDDETYENIHYRKSATLPQEPRDNPADIKQKRSLSLKQRGVSPKPLVTDEADFSKKRFSSVKLQSHKDKERLHESDDKVVKKSFSLKSPSLKGIFMPQYEQHRNDADGSEGETEDDATVPQLGLLAKEDKEERYNAPIPVPSPSKMTTSTPIGVTLHSPCNENDTPTIHVPSSQMSSPPSSPLHTGTSPTAARVPVFSTTMLAPNPPAIRTQPQILVVDDFDAKFGGTTVESFNDEQQDSQQLSKTRVNSISDEDDTTMDFDHLREKSKSGLLSNFSANKPKKLK